MPSKDSPAVLYSGNLNDFDKEKSSEGKKQRTKLSDLTTKSFGSKKKGINNKSINSI